MFSNLYVQGTTCSTCTGAPSKHRPSTRITDQLQVSSRAYARPDGPPGLIFAVIAKHVPSAGVRIKELQTCPRHSPDLICLNALESHRWAKEPCHLSHTCNCTDAAALLSRRGRAGDPHKATRLRHHMQMASFTQKFTCESAGNAAKPRRHSESQLSTLCTATATQGNAKLNMSLASCRRRTQRAREQPRTGSLLLSSHVSYAQENSANSANMSHRTVIPLDARHHAHTP